MMKRVLKPTPLPSARLRHWRLQLSLAISITLAILYLPVPPFMRQIKAWYCATCQVLANVDVIAPALSGL